MLKLIQKMPFFPPILNFKIIIKQHICKYFILLNYLNYSELLKNSAFTISEIKK